MLGQVVRSDYFRGDCKRFIDWSKQHFEDEKLKKDELRTVWLESQGLVVLRFTNFEVDRHFFEVCERIREVVDQRLDELADK